MSNVKYWCYGCSQMIDEEEPHNDCGDGMTVINKGARS